MYVYQWTCAMKRPKKYISEALLPVTEFRKYKMLDSMAIRKFYSLVRATIKGTRAVGTLKLLIDKQILLGIMGKMPRAD